MRRYLLAWELGGDLGHARRQAAIARGLRRLGHEVLLALADMTRVDVRALDGIGWVPAPRVPLPDASNPVPMSATDILVSMGYADAAALAGAISGWTGLLRAFSPHAVVGDFAPGAMLAARLAGVRRIGVGSGFSAPPAGEPMPAIRPGQIVAQEALRRVDERLMSGVREACARASPRSPAPQRARELFEAEAQLVCAWPELDPFGPRAGIEYLGPQLEGAADPAVCWNGDAAPRVFAYLKPRDARFMALLDALAATSGDAVVAAPGLDAAQAAALSRERVRVLAHAVDLPSTLAGADLCVAHSGAGAVAAATAAGVPLALLPRNVEQWLIALRAQALGHAVMALDGPPIDFAAWLRTAHSREDLRGAARAARAVARPPLDAAERIASLA